MVLEEEGTALPTVTVDETVSDRLRCAGLNVSIVSDILMRKSAEAGRRPPHELPRDFIQVAEQTQILANDQLRIQILHAIQDYHASRTLYVKGEVA